MYDELELVRQIHLLQRRLDDFPRPEVLKTLLIAETILTGSVASVTFSSLPATYRELNMRYQAATDRAEEFDTLAWRANSDAGNNYAYHYAYIWIGANPWGAGAVATDSGRCGRAEGDNSRASNFGTGWAQWIGYALTDRERISQAYGGSMGLADDTDNFYIWWDRSQWRNTAAAISSLTFLPVGGANFVSGSRFTMYGVS